MQEHTIMPIQLSDTQRTILTAACARPDGAVFPIEAGVKGGAIRKVLGALATRGLVEGEGVGATATALAWETLGLARAEATAAEADAAVEPTAGSETTTVIEPVADNEQAPPEIAASQASYRNGTKQAQLSEMLKSTTGATITEAVAATGWQAHTVRGAIAGALKRRLGLTITSEKVEGRGRVYRIAA
jgi:hypothetical protein